MSSPFKKMLSKLRILPILIVVASLAFVVRVGDAVVTFKSLSGEAVAETPVKEEAQKAADAMADAIGTKPSNTSLKTPEQAEKEGETAKSNEIVQEGKASGGEEKTRVWEDANDLDTDYTDIKAGVYEDLAARRKQLDAREKTLEQREALLEAGQKELDRKYKELKGLRDEIQGLLKQQSKDESERLGSLVKIYSTMKPKNAAAIFNTLDMDVLVEVVGRMPESKTAPILAAMNPDRARALTMLLAEQRKLPDVP